MEILKSFLGFISGIFSAIGTLLSFISGLIIVSVIVVILVCGVHIRVGSDENPVTEFYLNKDGKLKENITKLIKGNEKDSINNSDSITK